MKPTLTFLIALLPAQLAALHADEPAPVRDERVSSSQSAEPSAALTIKPIR
jgi:hypothetical protein